MFKNGRALVINIVLLSRKILETIGMNMKIACMSIKKVSNYSGKRTILFSVNFIGFAPGFVLTNCHI